MLTAKYFNRVAKKYNKITKGLSMTTKDILAEIEKTSKIGYTYMYYECCPDSFKRTQTELEAMGFKVELNRPIFCNEYRINFEINWK